MKKNMTSEESRELAKRVRKRKESQSQSPIIESRFNKEEQQYNTSYQEEELFFDADIPDDEEDWDTEYAEELEYDDSSDDYDDDYEFDDVDPINASSKIPGTKTAHAAVPHASMSVRKGALIEDKKHKAHLAETEDENVPKTIPKKILAIVRGALHEPVLVICATIFLLLFVFFRMYLVPSESMVPTLVPGDRMITQAIYFPTDRSAEIGDIICFYPPTGVKQVYVKRVIARGGDHLQISGEQVYVNGELSPWQGNGSATSIDTWIPEGYYWTMGDNRGNSADSRVYSYVPAENLISKVCLIYWPLNRAGLVN